MPHTFFNLDTLKNYCSSLPGQWRSHCFSVVANTIIEEDSRNGDDAVLFCAGADDEKTKNDCYSFIARSASFNFQPGSEALADFCAELPDPWDQVCFTGR